MIKKLLENNITFASNVLSWEEAINLSAKPLLNKNLIKQSYIDKIITSVKEQGFYIIISPDIALPHARFKEGVNEICISLLLSKNNIQFGEHRNIKIVFLVGFIDDNSHIKMLEELANFLTNQENLQKLLTATKESDVLQLFN